MHECTAAGIVCAVMPVPAHCNLSIFRHKGASKKELFFLQTAFCVPDVPDVPNVATIFLLTRWHLFPSLYTVPHLSGTNCFARCNDDSNLRNKNIVQ